MNTIRASVILLAIVLLIGLGVYSFLLPAQVQEVQEVKEVTREGVTIAASAPSKRPSGSVDSLERQARVPAVEESAPEIDLASQLQDATDLRKFSIEVQSYADKGGISYAMYATELCRNVRMILERSPVSWEYADLPYQAPEDPLVHAKRNDAFHKAKAACQGFNESDLSDSYLSTKAQLQGDPLHQLRTQAEEIDSSSSMDDRKTVLAAVLENGDPLLVAQSLKRLLLSDRTGGGVNIWVEGTQMPVAQREMYFTALQVLHCKLGLLCNELTNEVFSECIASGNCYSSQVDMVRSKMPAEYRDKFDVTLAELESAVRSKRVEQFLP